VAVAVAWALYLIPKAIEHHHAANSSRTVDRFSHRLRVLARREPVDKRSAQLVVTGASPAGSSAAGASAARASSAGASADAPVLASDPVPGPSPAEIRARREASRVAARRRRRVLLLLLVAVAVVAGFAAYGTLLWRSVAIPGGLVLAWLVLSRVVVKHERRAWARRLNPAPAPVESATVSAAEPSVKHDPEATTEAFDRAALAEGMRDPQMWDPVPVTLPTYVSKPVAERGVRTIDLESSGVWTSGRTEADAALARKADEAARAEREADQGEAPGAAAGA